MTFLNLNKTLGWTAPYPKISDWPFTTMDFSASYGLEDLTADSIDSLFNRLKANHTLAINYLVQKVGMDLSDQEQVSYGKYFYISQMGTFDANLDTTKYFCQMSKSLSLQEMVICYTPSNVKTLLEKFKKQFIN
jgi:hypothetical protein